MASRRCLNALTHQLRSLASLNSSFQSVRALHQLRTLVASDPLLLENPTSITYRIGHTFESTSCIQSQTVRPYSSGRRNSSKPQNDDDDNEADEDDDIDEDEDENENEEEMGESSDGDGEGDHIPVSNCVSNRSYSLEETEKEADAIGYKVVGPLGPSERPFKPWEPVFAVVQIGSHQFKVSSGDCIYTERLKFCEVNDKLILNRVLMLGSKTQTIIGRPTLSDAAVHAVVEEHALDAKVIIFKKKRRKNYRRTKGHRQELTKLRITDIQGIEKPEMAAAKKPEKVAVAA